MFMRKKYTVTFRLFTLFIACLFFFSGWAENIQFIYVSDTHYGLFREFRGEEKVSSIEVNRAMIDKMNLLPFLTLPQDDGVNQGKQVGGIDMIINTGDIASRAEEGIQCSADSWKDFATDWIDGRLNVRNAKGKPAPLYLLPGNHEVSNAIGHHKQDGNDPTAQVEIYNRMMKPQVPRINTTYNHETDKVNYSFTLSGVHFVFVGMWPDLQGRAWITDDLKKNSKASIPTLLFTHDQPDVEAKHFINPNGSHDVNAKDRFENLLSDTCSVLSSKDIPLKERRELARFLKQSPSIKAYFHGNENYNQYYVWNGPDNDIAIPVIRVESAMKGVYSSDDESLLSFQLVTIDTDTKQMTVRECLWNVANSLEPIVWGENKTFTLAP